MPLIYLVAGESSGDVLGGRLMAALAAARPGLRFAGVGGAEMAGQGLESLFPMRDLALMGFLEVAPRLRQLTRRLAETEADIRRLRPDAVVTIDSPGFALRLLRRIAPLGIPRAHYVAPQAWAWRERRVKHFPGLWESLLCLLPFEPAFFARHGIAASFVGHPVLQSGAEHGDGRRFRARHGIGADAPVLTVMPGSRRSEVGRMLPVFEAAVARVAARVNGLRPVVPVAAPVAATVLAATRGWAVPPVVVTETPDKLDAFAASAAALTKSGTSTLELALAGVPMLVAHRANPATAAIVRRLVIFATYILTFGGPLSGFAASLALSVMMLPIIIRASDVVIRLVPGSLKEASLALGAGQWRTMWHVTLPTARSGLTTAVILGMARGIGETSPVLLTAGYTTRVNGNPFAGPQVSLPRVILEMTRSPQPTNIARGFGAGATLLVLVLVLFVIARAIGGRGPGNLTRRQEARAAAASRKEAARFERVHAERALAESADSTADSHVIVLDRPDDPS